MNVRIKKRSKHFAEILEGFKTSSIVKASVLCNLVSSLKNDCRDIVKSGHKQNQRLKQVVSDIDDLELSINELSDYITQGTGKLVKEYSWLKNKLGLLEDERQNFKILYELSSILDKETELEKLLDAVINSIKKILDAEYGVIKLIDEKRNIRFSKEVTSKNNDEVLLELKDKVVDAAVDSSSSIIMNNLILKNKKNGDRGKFGSVMCLPLKSDENIIGTMYFGAYRKSFTADEADLLEALGERIAKTVESNFKYNQVIESQQKILADLRNRYDFDEIIGNSPEMAAVMSTISDVAESDTTVLIEGESGTGKEVIARAIHKNSLRENDPFIPINCSAIPETLLESELFGYEKGAFTGAVSRKEGKFELANGGTIFLDEIGELSMALQVKLLRFLQSHEFEPLGSNKLIKSDVRIIAATKRDLTKMVEEGKFRDDLFYRINVIDIFIPPLRERKGDIPLLVNHFIKKYIDKNKKEIDGISKEALNIIEQFSFPGNVRELENVIERAVVLCKNKIIGVDDLPDVIRSAVKEGSGVVEPLEKDFIIRALRKTGGNISEAARVTQMGRRQFQRLMRRYNLELQDIFNPA